MGFFSEIASEARRSSHVGTLPKRAAPEQQHVPSQEAPPEPAPAAPKPEPAPAPEQKEQPPEPSAHTPPPPEVKLAVGDTAPAADDDAKRKAHEAAEAKRKAEFDAKQAEKKAARQAALDRIAAMNGAELLAAAVDRVAADTERLTRRNMKEAVAEHIQAKCREDAAFAMLVMDPAKSMVNSSSISTANLDAMNAELDALQAARKKELRQKTKLLGKIAELDADDDLYDSMYEDLHSVLRQRTQSIADLDDKIEQVSMSIYNAGRENLTAEQVRKVTSAYLDMLDIVPAEEERLIVHALVDSIEIHPKALPSGLVLKKIRFKIPLDWDGYDSPIMGSTSLTMTATTATTALPLAAPSPPTRIHRPAVAACLILT